MPQSSLWHRRVSARGLCALGLAVVLGAPVIVGVGFLMALAGDKKQALHDVIAGSVVIETGG